MGIKALLSGDTWGHIFVTAFWIMMAAIVIVPEIKGLVDCFVGK